MIRLGLALSVLSAAIVFAGGCVSGEKRVEATASKTVQIAAEGRTTITMKVAEELILQLPAPNRTDQEWRLVFHDPRMLWQKSDIVIGAGKATVSFVAQRSVQRTLLRFLLVPAATSREVEPVGSHEVVVRIEH